MKKLFLILSMGLVLCASVWAAGEGEKEAAAPKMDKIVYLSVTLHDNPELLPAWEAEFKRITGVEVEMKTVSSKSATDLMMAQFMAGEFPDVCKFGGEKMGVLARQEFIVPLNSFIDKSPGMKKLKDMYPSSFAAHSVGDEIYGIPAQVGAKRGLWIRTDILDKLGISMPKTLDQFVAALKKIRDGYPAPDGKPMFPYISKTYHHGYIAGIGNYFDVSLDPAIKRPGQKKFKEGWDSPQFKDFAEFMKMMWDEKLIDPDHALPQKASTTRSKLYAGKGALIFVWAHSYQSMVSELRKSFPEAELDLVPPLRNPKGGVLGLAVVPGYRPYVIMKSTKDPQFVWDKFIEPAYLNPEMVMLVERGIPNVSYKVENGIFIDNFEESGDHLGTRSPFNPEIKFPYKLPPLAEKAVEIETKYDGYFSKNGEYVVVDEPSVAVPAFDEIYSDMKDKKNQLFWKYVLGEHSFDDMMKQFEAYKKEINFDNILAQINEQ
jgi:ABC-type glycerol-3-phosphate transport system substrate-binding protein